MKEKLIALAAAVLLPGLAVYYSETMVPHMDAEPLKIAAQKPASFPDVNFTTPKGKIFHTHDLKEPTVLVHFWAAWCLPCHQEFPQLIKYVEAAHGKIALVSISLDDRYENSQQFLDKLDTSSPHLYWAWDKDKKLARSFGTVKVPETIVVNEGRVMADKIIGPGPWGEAAARKP